MSHKVTVMVFALNVVACTYIWDTSYDTLVFEFKVNQSLLPI